MMEAAQGFEADYRSQAARVLHIVRGGSTEHVLAAIRTGLPASTLFEMMDRYRIPEASIGRVMSVSRSTLARRKKLGRLTEFESDRLVRIAGLYAMAEDILGSRDAASRWMQESNRSLGGETPLDYAETEVGAREVEDLLGRISHGIAA
jgi:putative toxin-antitoxin system antitoxin component (TIGR02293 family)